MCYFNLPEITFNLYGYLQSTPQIKQENVVIDGRGHQVKKSFRGSKNDVIIFKDEKWEYLLKFQRIITVFLFSNTSTHAFHSTSHSVFFQKISYTRVVRISKITHVYTGDMKQYVGYENSFQN